MRTTGADGGDIAAAFKDAIGAAAMADAPYLRKVRRVEDMKTRIRKSAREKINVLMRQKFENGKQNRLSAPGSAGRLHLYIHLYTMQPWGDKWIFRVSIGIRAIAPNAGNMEFPRWLSRHCFAAG